MTIKKWPKKMTIKIILNDRLKTAVKIASYN